MDQRVSKRNVITILTLGTVAVVGLVSGNDALENLENTVAVAGFAVILSLSIGDRWRRRKQAGAGSGKSG